MDAPTPAPVETFVAVQRLVHRYADAVVHADADQWGSCWAEDAVWDLGGGQPIEGRAAIVAAWSGVMQSMERVVHLVHNGDVFLPEEDRSGDRDGDGDGEDRADTVTGRWYVTERYRTTSGADGVLLAHYDDTYVRTDGRWRFAARRLVAHQHGPADGSGDRSGTGG